MEMYTNISATDCLISLGPLDYMLCGDVKTVGTFIEFWSVGSKLSVFFNQWVYVLNYHPLSYPLRTLGIRLV